MKEDLIQYITNALYRAHDYDMQTMKPIEFDKWVEEQTLMLGLYFDSTVSKDNCPECGYYKGHIRGCQKAVRDVTDEEIEEEEYHEIHDDINEARRTGEIE
jgi:hypothetical protein